MDVNFVKEIVKNKYGENHPRFIHIMGVYNLATKLANKYGVDVYKAQIAALVHDFYKYETVDEMEEMIEDDFIIEKYKNNQSLYHAYASGQALRKELGIMDEEIYNAVIHHVYGSMNMSKLEEIILIADYCEENRTYKSCVAVREILDYSLNKAIYCCLDYTINFLKHKGIKVLDEQYMIRDQYKNKE